jgi:hypothetical protein
MLIPVLPFRPKLLVLSGLTLLLLQGASAQQEAKPKKSVAQRVNEAIDLGMEFLIKEQDLDGSWRFHSGTYVNGQTALCLYTLLKCGLPKDHPTVTRALLYLGDNDDRRTYTLGCYLMALSAHDPVKHLDLMDELAAQLVEAQTQGFSYPGGHEDMSLSQYAALGLRSAAKAGVKVDPRVWRRLLEFTLKHQEDVHRGPAGFSYRVGGTINGSMTSAGIACLILAREQLEAGGQYRQKDARRVDKALKQASEWIAEYSDFEHNPTPSVETTHHLKHRRHYWLYGLERAGSLLETEVFGEVHWYDELVRSVLDQQGKGGAWSSPFGEKQSNTCFTLLALRRATAASTGKRTRRGDLYHTRDKDAPVRLRAAGDVPLNIWIEGFGPKVIETYEWPEDKGLGPRVARVEYLTGERVIGTVQGNVQRPVDGLKLAIQQHFREPGQYLIRARVWLVHPGESQEDKIPVESPPMEVSIDEVMTPWMREYATDGGRNLLRETPKEVLSSSDLNGGWAKQQAVDGRMGTGWLSKGDDPERWIRIVLEKPLRASELALCPATQALWETRTIGSATRISVSINKRRAIEYAVNPDPKRKSILDLGKTHRIRQLEIRVLESIGQGAYKDSVGFAEIELRLSK